MGVSKSRHPFLNSGAHPICGIGEANYFEFGTQNEYGDCCYMLTGVTAHTHDGLFPTFGYMR